MIHRALIEDESGMTLVELLVATAAGVVVMFGIVASVVVTLRETDRVATHVDANQRARVAMTKIIEQLHSSCVAPQIAPVREGSGESTLIFWHQTGSAVAPTPIKSEITLSGTTLSQSDYTTNGGTAPNWTFNSTPSSTVQLMNNVSALPSTPVFRYFAYSSGQVSSTPLTAPLTKTEAAKVVQVNVAFQTAPQSTPISSDSSAKTGIQDSALLRLTPPGYSTSASNLPCQ